MKPIWLFVVSLFCCLNLAAQSEQEELYALTTSTLTMGLGSERILDPYLSPFEYDGVNIGVQGMERRFFKANNNKLSYNHKANFNIGTAYHPNRNNSMSFFHIDYLYGVNYHFRPVNRLMVLAGGAWDIGVGGKYLARNVNNPFSLDLFTNLNATAEVQYLLHWLKRDFRFQYGAKTPLLGCMFVPQQGATYYEMFALNNLKDAFHLSSLHNRQAWNHYIHIDIPVKFTTFRLSLQHDVLHYTANDIVFKRNSLMCYLGVTVDLFTFSGTKRKIPTNFIRSYE